MAKRRTSIYINLKYPEVTDLSRALLYSLNIGSDLFLHENAIEQYNALANLGIRTRGRLLKQDPRDIVYQFLADYHAITRQVFPSVIASEIINAQQQAAEVFTNKFLLPTLARREFLQRHSEALFLIFLEMIRDRMQTVFRELGRSLTREVRDIMKKHEYTGQLMRSYGYAMVPIFQRGSFTRVDREGTAIGQVGGIAVPRAFGFRMVFGFMPRKHLRNLMRGMKGIEPFASNLIYPGDTKLRSPDEYVDRFIQGGDIPVTEADKNRVKEWIIRKLITKRGSSLTWKHTAEDREGVLRDILYGNSPYWEAPQTPSEELKQEIEDLLDRIPISGTLADDLGFMFVAGVVYKKILSKGPKSHFKTMERVHKVINRHQRRIRREINRAISDLTTEATGKQLTATDIIVDNMMNFVSSPRFQKEVSKQMSDYVSSLMRLRTSESLHLLYNLIANFYMRNVFAPMRLLEMRARDLAQIAQARRGLDETSVFVLDRMVLHIARRLVNRLNLEREMLETMQVSAYGLIHSLSTGIRSVTRRLGPLSFAHQQLTTAPREVNVRELTQLLLMGGVVNGKKIRSLRDAARMSNILGGFSRTLADLYNLSIVDFLEQTISVQHTVQNTWNYNAQIIRNSEAIFFLIYNLTRLMRQYNRAGEAFISRFNLQRFFDLSKNINMVTVRLEERMRQLESKREQANIKRQIQTLQKYQKGGFAQLENLTKFLKKSELAELPEAKRIIALQQLVRTVQKGIDENERALKRFITKALSGAKKIELSKDLTKIQGITKNIFTEYRKITEASVSPQRAREINKLLEAATGKTPEEIEAEERRLQELSEKVRREREAEFEFSEEFLEILKIFGGAAKRVPEEVSIVPEKPRPLIRAAKEVKEDILIHFMRSMERALSGTPVELQTTFVFEQVLKMAERAARKKSRRVSGEFGALVRQELLRIVKSPKSMNAVVNRLAKTFSSVLSEQQIGIIRERVLSETEILKLVE